MGKRIWVLLAGLALAAGLLIWYAFFRGTRPFARLEGTELRAASLCLSPPDVTLELTEAEREELAGLLRRAVIHRRDDRWREYAGQGGDLYPGVCGRHRPHGDRIFPLFNCGRGGLPGGVRPL